MGGPRITDVHKEQMRELRQRGMTVAEISRMFGVSQYAVRQHTLDIEVKAEDVLLQPGELLADIDGYDGYKISSHGRVFSTSSPDGLRPLKLHKSKRGGYKTTLRKDGVTTLTRVDYLVAGKFCEHGDDETVLVHVDGDLFNSNASNLKWLNPLNDIDESLAGPKKRKPVLDDWAIADVRKRWLAGESAQSLACDHGVSVSTIYLQIEGLLRDVPEPPCEAGEEWRPVAGCEDKYLVSSHGRVYSTGCGRRDPRMLVHSVNYAGYHHVSLSTDEGYRRVAVHRLVASAFCDGYDEKRNIVNHKDGDPANNHADNLEWCTPGENTRHAIDVLGHTYGGEVPFGMRTPREVAWAPGPSSTTRRFTDDEVVSIRNDPRSARQLSKLYGVNKTTIINLRRGFTYRNVP